MSEKRRDSKNRILRTGESQKKNGRYVYKYNPAPGISKFIYSWKLVPTDRVPPGKRPDLSLREKEQAVRRDLEDGIDTLGGQMTLCQLYAKHNRLHPNVRTRTVFQRDNLMRILREDGIGLRPIASIKLSDAKEWALRMKENGYGFQTICNHKRSLKAAFYIAIQDDLARRNPFDFKLTAVIDNDTRGKIPLSPSQKESLLDFLRYDRTYRRYRDEVIVLLGTGLRISEMCGLTDADLDFAERLIHVERQLLKTAHIGYHIAPPKTRNGARIVPMSAEVCAALKRILAQRGRARYAPVGGVKGFLFLTREGLPKVAYNYEKAFQGLVAKYNRCHEELLPDPTTPHTMRHTFCTDMANAGMNPKALQYLMGHASIKMTLDYYAHTTPETAISEMRRLSA